MGRRQYLKTNLKESLGSKTHFFVVPSVLLQNALAIKHTFISTKILCTRAPPFVSYLMLLACMPNIRKEFLSTKLTFLKTVYLC